VCLKQDL
jgi:hypothetical protein